MKYVLDGTNPMDITWYNPYSARFYFQFQLIWDLHLKQNEGTLNTLKCPEM